MSFTRKTLFADERGVSAIEYSLLAALIGLGLVTSVQAAGIGVVASFDNVQAAFVDAMQSDDGPPSKNKPGKGKPAKPPNKKKK